MTDLREELAAIVLDHVPDSMEKGAIRDLLDALIAWTDAQAGLALAKNSVAYIDDCEQKIAGQRALTDEILSKFTQEGHPGRPCLRTGWVTTHLVDEWRQRNRGAT